MWWSGLQNGRAARMRADYRLASTVPMENAPPLIAFTTVALGGFSTLIADALWFRVSMLQDEGRFFELVQLSDWITKLEPRCGEIWTFHAWNMAYNISIMMPDQEDRWRWVRRGIELLRDEGVRYNPGDPQVYQELGWLFLHKIAGITDQTHMYYKAMWAGEMTALFDGGYPDYDKLSKQPDILRKVTEEYKLNPEIMRRIDAEYGPRDWRMSETHALYWAVCGRNRCWDERGLSCERLILQSLGEMFKHESLPAGPDKLVVPLDMGLFQKIMKAYESARKRFPSEKYFMLSQAGFMREAVVIFYTHDRKTEARALFDRLAVEFPTPDMAGGFEAFVTAITSRNNYK